MFFKDRAEAGRLLADALKKYKDKDTIVYALPRGGVITAVEIAKELNAPIDLIITRKIGHPLEPEYAIGAVAENGHIVKGELDFSAIDKKWFNNAIKEKKEEAQRRRIKYLSGRKKLSGKGKIAILVDDGIATGLTIRAGILELKHQNPQKIVVAVPVAPKEVVDQLKKEADEVIILDIPKIYLGAVGSYYEDFSPVEDKDVVIILSKYYDEIVQIKVDSVIEGSLEGYKDARGIVLFAHGSGSGRFSPRNNYVAKVLRENKLSTLLIDLLTEKEDLIYENRFDINLLTDRLLLATDWILKNPKTKDLPIGYFGASTGAAAALRASVILGEKIKALVSRGGRPDLAVENLNAVESPTLLIVGGNDEDVIDLNKMAYEKLKCIKKMKIIKGATHLFEEPGALEEVAELAAKWFVKYLL